MTRLQKWDQRVLSNGNRMTWVRGSLWFGISRMETLFEAIGAWGRKRNLIWLGSWKEGYDY
tara:strand:+ start:2456 stop:2638 length:183 start_codon:yes stop_codon:yes gene_type:complete